MASYDNKIANGKALEAIKNALGTKADSSGLGAAAAKGVDTSISNISSVNLPTSSAVNDFVVAKLQSWPHVAVVQSGTTNGTILVQEYGEEPEEIEVGGLASAAYAEVATVAEVKQYLGITT